MSYFRNTFSEMGHNRPGFNAFVKALESFQSSRYHHQFSWLKRTSTPQRKLPLLHVGGNEDSPIVVVVSTI